MLAQIIKPFAQEAADKAVPAAKELSEGATLISHKLLRCRCNQWHPAGLNLEAVALVLFSFFQEPSAGAEVVVECRKCA